MAIEGRRCWPEGRLNQILYMSVVYILLLIRAYLDTSQIAPAQRQIDTSTRSSAKTPQSYARACNLGPSQPHHAVVRCRLVFFDHRLAFLLELPQSGRHI